MMMPTLHIRLLGDFSLIYNDRQVTSLNTTRLRSLLAYLVLHRDVPQQRQHFTSCARPFRLWSNSSLPTRTWCTGTPSRPSTLMSLSSNRHSLSQTRLHDGMTSTRSKTFSSRQTACIAVNYSLAAMMNGSCLNGIGFARATCRSSNNCCVSLKCRATPSPPSGMPSA